MSSFPQTTAVACLSETGVDHLNTLKTSLIQVVRFLYDQGWTPATTSNFSIRSPERTRSVFAISISGKDKQDFSVTDFVEVSEHGCVIDPEKAHIRPSAETLLHAMVYRSKPEIQTVLHTHSVCGTVVSMLYKEYGGLTFKDFEILKAFDGIKTHEQNVFIPIFPNSQDIKTLSKHIARYFSENGWGYGFLLAGHGLYTWGKTPEEAKRHVEVFEFLFECVLKLRSHGYPDYSR